MGEGRVIGDDFSDSWDFGTPRHWEDILTDEVTYDAQSLLGYGREVHLRSGGACLYCGFGVSWQVEPERGFDAWRQLTVEHIVPGEEGELSRAIEKEVETLFGNLPEDQRRKIIGLVMDLNKVTSCHLCNSSASRCAGRDYIGTAIAHFHEHLQAAAAGGVQEWIERLRRDIWEVWHLKSDLVRAKLMVLRRSFQDEGIRALLDVPLADTRLLATPRDLDEKLIHIMNDLMNSHQDLWGPPHV